MGAILEESSQWTGYSECSWKKKIHVPLSVSVFSEVTWLWIPFKSVCSLVTIVTSLGETLFTQNWETCKAHIHLLPWGLIDRKELAAIWLTILGGLSGLRGIEAGCHSADYFPDSCKENDICTTISHFKNCVKWKRRTKHNTCLHPTTWSQTVEETLDQQLQLQVSECH